jgi:CRISPR/Cas system CMR-associated protein Cmr5 small subunit
MHILVLNGKYHSDAPAIINGLFNPLAFFFSSWAVRIVIFAIKIANKIAWSISTNYKTEYMHAATFLIKNRMYYQYYAE